MINKLITAVILLFIGSSLVCSQEYIDEEENELMAEIEIDESGSAFIGKKAPEFSITDIEGRHLSTEYLKGKILVLNFWFTFCKPCVKEIKELNKVYETFNVNNDIVFAAITFEGEEEVRDFLKKKHFSYPIIAADDEVLDLFGIQDYPTNIIIDKAGNYYYYSIGSYRGIGQEITRQIQGAIGGENSLKNLK